MEVDQVDLVNMGQYNVQEAKTPSGSAIVSSFGRQIAHLYASEIGIRAHHALAAGQLDWEHSDPFDRMLVAQALVEGFTLVTADDAIRAFDPVSTLW